MLQFDLFHNITFLDVCLLDEGREAWSMIGSDQTETVS
ncbi:hypothetical protein KNP414_05174 [Paenibacillus mucilaginosus KNP414]|uniref:Uncharacterized protein n=1 Tax=Paenibacillus mucilaginosus (strain KNP414) TaxID=1036673 RepID=F8F9K9_PAEMK|nr:hypothetical protein KNP414_05174 [Paenibacillus mucilaginosus KNP414]